MDEQQVEWMPCGKAGEDENDEFQRLLGQACESLGIPAEALGEVQASSCFPAAREQREHMVRALQQMATGEVAVVNDGADVVLPGNQIFEAETEEEEPEPERGEVYRIGHRRWNITALWQWIEDQGRQATDTIDVASAAPMVNIAGLNKYHALTVDLTRPLLTVYFPQVGAAMIVDGWHRVWRATQDGVETLPAHQITEDELNRFEITGE